MIYLNLVDILCPRIEGNFISILTQVTAQSAIEYCSVMSLQNLDLSLFVGDFKRVSLLNFSAYLDKLGVSEAKKKIALHARSFHNVISVSEAGNEVTIRTDIQYGVDFGTTTTETT